MRNTLINIADAIDKRVAEFKDFPRTQATDAMKGLGADLARIIRAEIKELPEVPEDLDGRIHAHCMNVITELLGETKNAAPTKKGGSK